VRCLWGRVALLEPACGFVLTETDGPVDGNKFLSQTQRPRNARSYWPGTRCCVLTNITNPSTLEPFLAKKVPTKHGTEHGLRNNHTWLWSPKSYTSRIIPGNTQCKVLSPFYGSHQLTSVFSGMFTDKFYDQSAITISVGTSIANVPRILQHTPAEELHKL
jgi:hypothetical protein